MGSWFNIKARRYRVSASEYEQRVSWSHLTEEERELVCDGGCGLRIFGKKIIPDIIFRDCCCHHDFAYLRGGDEHVRRLCDSAFQREMAAKVAASDDPAFFKAWATMYATAVRTFGWLAWDYGPMKTKEEILAAARKQKQSG